MCLSSWLSAGTAKSLGYYLEIFSIRQIILLWLNWSRDDWAACCNFPENPIAKPKWHKRLPLFFSPNSLAGLFQAVSVHGTLAPTIPRTQQMTPQMRSWIALSSPPPKCQASERCLGRGSGHEQIGSHVSIRLLNCSKQGNVQIFMYIGVGTRPLVGRHVLGVSWVCAGIGLCSSYYCLNGVACSGWLCLLQNLKCP